MPIDKLEGNKTEIFPPVRVRPYEHFINTFLQQNIAVSYDVTPGSDKTPCIKLDKPKMVFKTDYRLMQIKSIAEHSAILSTFIKLPFVIKIFVLSIFEWLLKTGFTVYVIS